MSQELISDLTNKATPASTDEIEIQETGGGLSKKTTFAAMQTLVQSPATDNTTSLGTVLLRYVSVFLSTAIKFVGTNFTTTVAYTDPSADRTITLPDDTGTAALTKDVLGLAGGTMTGTLIQKKGADIASATILVIGSDGNYFDVTGTTGFASMTVTAGTFFTVQFDGILILTHHATNLDLPGEANITTAAGDSMICFATAANAVHVISYTRADGKAVIGADPDLSNLTATGNDKIATAWVNFNGTSTVAVRDSYNVSGITDNGVGDYTINFSTTMANANYAFAGSSDSANTAGRVLAPDNSIPRTTYGIRVIADAYSVGKADVAYASGIIFGGL